MATIVDTFEREGAE